MPKISIHSTYTQKVETIHPDVIIDVPFIYLASVNQKNEEVEIKYVFLVDGQGKIPVRITPKSEFESSLLKFLANIREHAREQAYKQKQSSHVPAT